MILSTDQIREMLANPAEDLNERLVISPLLDPSKQLKPGNASVDVRLGERFTVPLRTKVSHLDRLSKDHAKQVRRYKDQTFVPIGSYFVLHPRQFVLGETLEWVRLPRNLAAYVVGRSTWGRDGLVIATATGVHPNFSGVLTLEIGNIGEIPLYLYPGLAIAQLFITRVETSITDRPPEPSSFQSQTGPHGRELELEDQDIIREFQQRLG